MSNLYGWYYFGLEFAGLALALASLKLAAPKPRQALKWMAAGYVVILVPTFIINVLLPLTRAGIPSIMCGFAVIFAIILGLKIAPLALSRDADPSVLRRFIDSTRR